MLPVAAKVATVGLLATGGLTSLAAQLQHEQGIDPIATQAAVSASQSAPCPLSWQVILAQSIAESGAGTSGGAHLLANGDISKPIGSRAGAQGPSQFMAGTWQRWQRDGNGDGVADIDNIFDSMAAQAAMDCALGITTDLEGALRAYNSGSPNGHSAETNAYVQTVSDHLVALDRFDSQGFPLTLPESAAYQGDSGTEWITPGEAANKAMASIWTGWEKLDEQLNQPKYGSFAKLWHLFSDPVRSWWTRQNGQPHSSNTHPIGLTQVRLRPVMDFLDAQLGKPYVYGGAGPDDFDCSGLTMVAYRLIGVDLPHDATLQAQAGLEVPIGPDYVRTGDLLFHFGDGVPNGHVIVALDATRAISAPRTGENVQIVPIDWTKITAVRRMVLGGSTQGV
jgi:cell wall-associated NlpC family hydrolase